MLDHCNNQFSSNPTHQISGDVVFNFWGNLNASDSGETGLQGHFDEEFDDYTIGLWKTNTSRNVRNETYPLLPYNHHYSNISPRTRSQAIAESRKELMDRIHDMPESSYELSLKDIVDEQLAPEEVVHEEKKTEGTSFHFNTSETQIKKQKMKITRNIGKSCQISRSGSMEKETFMIKLFVPSSLSWKKKVKGENGSKVSPWSPLHGFGNQVDKKWGIKRFLAVGDGKGSDRSNSSSGSISTNSSSSCCFSGCWPFFGTKKRQIKRHGGCIFSTRHRISLSTAPPESSQRK